MRLSETDASFIYNESVSGPMHISSVYVLEGELPFEKFLTRFEKRIHLVPTYRKKLLQVPFSLGHPVWADDANFDLQNHVIHHQVPQGSSLEEAMDIAVELNEPIMDRDKPLWKMLLIEGVPGKTLLLQMTHHAMIDGASGIALTMVLYDLAQNAGEPVPPNEPWQPEPAPGPAQLMSDAIQDNIRDATENNPISLMSRAVANREKLTKATSILSRFAQQPAITAPFNAGVVGPKRKVRWMKKSFAEIRDIRKQLGGTINDVVLTVVSEAVARYLKAHDERVDGQFMRIMCPVNVRTESQQGALGNQVSAIFPLLPTEPMDCLQRLNVVIAETERIKRDEEAQAMTVLQESMPTLPPLGMIASQLVGTNFDPTAVAARMPLPPVPSIGGYRPPNLGYNFTCTNVPGVQVPQYMCGHEVTDTVGLLVLNGNVGFSITILSYNKKLFFNFICEPRLLPDLELIVQGADDVFQELMSAAQQKNKIRQA
ncbi:MAG: diacylglycerol O-acyltransferase [Candidatus Azotimanducaceae bacterium]|jgi:diacylglycerol O-acyltransferase